MTSNCLIWSVPWKVDISRRAKLKTRTQISTAEKNSRTLACETRNFMDKTKCPANAISSFAPYVACRDYSSDTLQLCISGVSHIPHFERLFGQTLTDVSIEAEFIHGDASSNATFEASRAT
jgi:hypothetical protein